MSIADAENLQQLAVAVIHPEDDDGDAIVRHLQRVGCRVHHVWPAPPELPAPADAAFLSLHPDEPVAVPAVPGPAPAVIAVTGPGDLPATLRTLAASGAHAVLRRPIEAFDLLAALVLARSNLRAQTRLQAKVAKLENTVQSVRVVEQAKSILMRQHAIEEPEAYRYLRGEAMSRRLSVGAVAAEVIAANGLPPGVNLLRSAAR